MCGVVRGLLRSADYQRQGPEFESGMPQTESTAIYCRTVAVRGKGCTARVGSPQCLWAINALTLVPNPDPVPNLFPDPETDPYAVLHMIPDPQRSWGDIKCVKNCFLTVPAFKTLLIFSCGCIDEQSWFDICQKNYENKDKVDPSAAPRYQLCGIFFNPVVLIALQSILKFTEIVLSNENSSLAIRVVAK
jgi:hypothetical protein